MIKQKNIAVCIILCIVTCGLYTLYWLYSLNEDINQLTGDFSSNGALVVILSIVTCGLYLFYWTFRMGEKLDFLKQSRGIPSSNSGILYLILTFIGAGTISYALIQHEINKLVGPTNMNFS